MLEEIRAKVTEFPDLVICMRFDEKGVDINVSHKNAYSGLGQVIPWESMPTYRNPDVSLDEIVRMTIYRYLHDSGSLKRGDIYGK